VYDVIVRGGVGPAGEALDVAVADGVIAAVGRELGGTAAETLSAEGCYILPGLVDSHVHVSGRFGKPVGFRMLVRAGVTAALDLAGDAQDLRATLPAAGCGLTVGALHALIPGDTVADDSPSERTITEILDRQLELGAHGLKVLGGHFPLTPEATHTVLEVCGRRSVYCAVHAGTTATGSDVTGVEELVALAGDLPVHVAHVNSYCRGQIEDPTAEASRALQALAGLPGAWSESYLSTLNGAEARCEHGVPVSRVVRTCLRLGGFEETQDGLERAIGAGWGRIQVESEDDVGFASPEEGLAWFRAGETSVGISFPVNPASSALALALARTGEGTFAVDAFGSDGGSIPRNTILSQGLGLVRSGFLSLAELVLKGSRAPALRLGLQKKGMLEPGADADVIVATRDGACRDSVIDGRVVMRSGRILVPGVGKLLPR
jgi:hypothetical protein